MLLFNVKWKQKKVCCKLKISLDVKDFKIQQKLHVNDTEILFYLTDVQQQKNA
jgi:hypothetical protein